jgi:hypothetical protein
MVSLALVTRVNLQNIECELIATMLLHEAESALWENPRSTSGSDETIPPVRSRSAQRKKEAEEIFLVDCAGPDETFEFPESVGPAQGPGGAKHHRVSSWG